MRDLTTSTEAVTTWPDILSSIYANPKNLEYKRNKVNVKRSNMPKKKRNLEIEE